jgi:hypothetical protein
MTKPKWIRMIKLDGGIPSHAHPDDALSPVRLKGTFNVKWPDGTMSPSEVKTSKVSHRKRDGSDETGLYVYFDGLLHGMSVIYNLHEVELRDDEVVRCLAAPRKTRAA